MCNVLLLCLGRDQEAYEFLKYSVSNFRSKDTSFGHFKNMSKNEGSTSCKENFFAMDFFKGLSWATKNDVGWRFHAIVAYWLILAIIKINVIEEMKQKLAKMKANFEMKVSRKKFSKQDTTIRQRLSEKPKILEGLFCFLKMMKRVS